MPRNSSPVPDDLPVEAKNRLYWWHCEKYAHHFRDRSSRVTFVADEIEKCLDHHGARGNPGKIVDWERAARNWLRKAMEMRGYETHRPPSSRPNPRGTKPFEEKSKPMEPIQSQLRLVK